MVSCDLDLDTLALAILSMRLIHELRPTYAASLVGTGTPVLEALLPHLAMNQSRCEDAVAPVHVDALVYQAAGQTCFQSRSSQGIGTEVF